MLLFAFLFVIVRSPIACRQYGSLGRAIVYTQHKVACKQYAARHGLSLSGYAREQYRDEAKNTTTIR